ncbi:retinal guanylyl cyclase 2-like isoform X1 [Ptychodera flava]
MGMIHTHNQVSGTRDISELFNRVFFRTSLLLLMQNIFLCKGGENFTIGLLAPLGCDSLYSSAMPQIATELAIDDIKNNPQFLANINLEYLVHNSSCSGTGELVELVGLLTEKSLDAIIGPVDYAACEPIARLAGYWTTPLVSWTCTQSELSDRSTYSSFARTVSSNVKTANALSAIMLRFRWKYSVVISSSDAYWQGTARDIIFSLRQANLVVVEFLTIKSDASREDIAAVLERVPTNAKGIILCVASRSMNSTDQEEIMIAAQELGMTQGSHAFFAVDTLASVWLEGERWFQGASDPDGLRRAYEALFVLTVQPSLDFSYDAMMQDFDGKMSSVPFRDVFHGGQVCNLFAQVYDSVYVLAYAMNKTLTSGDPLSGEAISDFMKNMKFDGLSGEVKLNNNGDRTMCYILLDYDRGLDSFREVLKVNFSYSGDEYHVMDVDGAVIQWPGGVVLEADADCLFNGESCGEDGVDTLYIAGILIAALLLIFIFIGAYLIIRRWKLKRDMAKGPNKILLTFGDLHFEPPNKIISGSRKLLDPDKDPSLKMNGGKALSTSPPATSEHRLSRSSTMFCDMSNLARYNGEYVRVKKLDQSNFDARSSTLHILKQIRDIRHENVNAFLGCYTELNNTALITEFCNKGSLEDVINSENIKLDWMFKSSLLLDLVSGMRYLHNSPIKHHGRLKSRNCVIDSRWVLKITDYGLPALLATQSNYQEPDKTPEDLLWSSPESLRDAVLMMKGSSKGDVYSFAIIVSELLTRGRPFSMLSLTAKEIIAKVRKPPPLCRPSVSQNEAPREVIEIMKQCWAELPDMRPDFETIYQLFKKLNQGRKTNIVDSMFKMLEKYSNHLEDLIRDRTQELAEEKKKTDMLLYRMLPPSVAESLKLGRQIEAESFSEVTIFFSDIVGFTTISAMSTPLQVVDFLNDLYTMFDDILSAYDCYKVETIGDAYMVVSGLPIRNGNKHAGEIATLALDLLHAAGFKFKIRHMPDKPLKLRIGLHTGPCVAGVVGLTMPRYCLFGDTVNTTSRMESTGQAFRIHINESVVKKLAELGGYHTQLRGEVVLKGKGIAKTHWLTGKDGFEKPLPDYTLYQEDDL